MSTVTIEFRSPELIEAINNLARAQIAATEALNRVASTGYSAGTLSKSQSSYPIQNPVMPSISGPQPAAVIKPAYKAPKQFSWPDQPLTQPTDPENTYPIMSTAPAISAVPANTAQPGLTPSYTQASPEHNLTLDDLARAVASLMGAGKYMLIVDLLAKFGVQALFQLPKGYFGAFAAALRQLGAQI